MVLEETRKSWEEVGKRTQEKRRRVVLDVCEKMKVPPSALAEPSQSPLPLSPEETIAKLPRWTQRNTARTVGAPIASERQIHHKRLHDSDTAGIRVLVALRGPSGDIILTRDEPCGEDADFATVVEDPVKLIQNHTANLEKLPDDKVNRPRVRHLVFIGDFGQNFFSFGVHFVGDPSHSKEAFLPLYMHHGLDSVDKFRIFGHSVISSLNAFDFSAAGYEVFLGGDMKWLNGAQGLMGTSSFFFVPNVHGGSIMNPQQSRLLAPSRVTPRS